MLLRHLARLSSTSLLRSHNQLWIRPQSARWFSQELVASWPEGIKGFLKQEKIERPTLIQEKTLPIAMENNNLVGIARTGSGKTLASVIPDEAKEGNTKQIRSDKGNDALARPARKATCLVPAITRELATQTSSVFGFNSMSLVGRPPRSDQNHMLVRHFHAKGSKVRYLDFRYRFNTCHIRTHLLIIRRQKMKKHRRTKWRKRFKALLAKKKLKREISKEKTFRVELLTMIKRAEQFDPREYALKKINEINSKPRELTKEEKLEQLKKLIRENRYQVEYIKPKHKRAESI